MKKLRSLSVLLFFVYLSWLVWFYEPWNYNKEYFGQISIAEKIVQHSYYGGYLIPKRFSVFMKENVLVHFHPSLLSSLFLDTNYFLEGKSDFGKFKKIVSNAQKFGYSINDKIDPFKKYNAMEMAILYRNCEAVKHLLSLGASPDVDVLKRGKNGIKITLGEGLRNWLNNRDKLIYRSNEEKIKDHQDFECIIEQYRKLGIEVP